MGCAIEFGTSGALGVEAVEAQNLFLHFGWDLEDLRTVMENISD